MKTSSFQIDYWENQPETFAIEDQHLERLTKASRYLPILLILKYFETKIEECQT